MTDSPLSIPTRLIERDALFERLRAGHALVTGNSRLSRVLTHAYSQWRIARGDRQWRSPQILPWAAWLGRLWESAALEGLVENRRAVPGGRQLTNLWERVLRADAQSQVLLRPESLATTLRDTRSLVREWLLDLSDPAWFGDQNENQTAFHRWNRSFEELCDREGWLPPEDRAALLCAAMDRQGLSRQEPVDLLGFDEFNPAQAGLIEALTGAGIEVNILKFMPRQGKVVQWRSKDRTREMRQMARWVRHWYEQEPESTIAVVVPELENRRAEVERHLQEILAPASGRAEQGQIPWNISMGTPLSREPLIQTAFDLLKLLDGRFDIQEAGRVLRSPWLRGGLSERNSRALLEKCLRDNHPRQLKLSELRYRAREMNRFDRQRSELPPELQEPQPWNSPKFSAVLDRLADFRAGNLKARKPSAWAEQLDQLLVSLGWPLKGEARSTEQNDRNWQALQAWRESLRELSSLDATTDTFSCAAAIGQLHRICRERIFQPQTPPARIQVLGLFEVSGLRFDHLWVLGLHNDNWPPAATPNPFIPRSLQLRAGIPHSSPQRELDVAKIITRRLLETAPDCVFSYPGQLDGEEVLASPLLMDPSIEVLETVPGWPADRWPSVIFKAPGPQTKPLRMPGRMTGPTARGGSSILKHQALCPFRAFASNRLAAEPLESPADGISPKLHGSLVHKVLELFWRETATQAALLQLDEDSLRARVRRQVEYVVGEEIFLQQRPTFGRVEANRLERQALASLALEKAREPFTVTGFEQEILPVIEGQTIRLVIDRIDRTDAGEDIIIDYKTGKVDPKKWFGDRPEDPQLPLYAISTQETPAAVTFAIVRDDGCLYSGVVRREDLFPGLPPKPTRYTQELIDAGYHMPETITNWRQVLHRLMSAFLAGEAKVDPKNGRKTCDNSFCELQRLCRIDELQGIQTAQREFLPAEERK
jgi:ATP-dependent helicase/nuclease subunit B